MLSFFRMFVRQIFCSYKVQVEGVTKEMRHNYKIVSDDNINILFDIQNQFKENKHHVHVQFVIKIY